MTKKQYFTLDGMRGIAAIFVVLFHADDLLGGAWVPSGYLAVDLFFVLSGFVVANAYEQRLKGKLSTFEFIKQRFIRFYPLYFAGLMLGVLRLAALFALGSEDAPQLNLAIAAIVLGLLFLPAPLYGQGDLFPVNIPSWSLLYELLVNLAYAAALRWLSTRTVAALAAISGLILAYAIFATGSADQGALLSHVGPAIARTVFSFSVGVLIFRNLGKIKLGLPPIVALIALGLALSVRPDPAMRAAYDAVFVFALSPLLVLLSVVHQPGQRMIPLYSFLGGASFVIYALHYPIIGLAKRIVQKLPDGAGPAFAAVILVGLLVTAPLIQRLYDEPVRRWLMARFARKVG